MQVRQGMAAVSGFAPFCLLAKREVRVEQRFEVWETNEKTQFPFVYFSTRVVLTVSIVELGLWLLWNLR